MRYTLQINNKWLLFFLFSIKYLTCYTQTFDAELLEQQTTIEIVNDKLVQKHFYRIIVNNRNGDKYSEITIPFNKLSEVSEIQATLIDNNGQVLNKLKKSDITQRSAQSDISFYSDTYIKEFSIRHNKYPYIIEYSYKETINQFLYLIDWIPILDTDIPTRQAILQVNVLKDYPIYFKSDNIGNPQIDSVGENNKYTWKASYSDIIESEVWSPNIVEHIPNVEIVPRNFYYEENGSNYSWNDYGNWNLKLLDGLNDLSETEKLKLHSITDSLPLKKDKVKALYHYLQDATRYINISVKTGGFKPYPASYVSERKYGDCKALSNYFQSCLSAVGISSYYSKIKAGQVIEPIDENFPSPQFNHIIVFIPLDQDTLWLDCTSDLAFSYLGTFTQNRKALVLSQNNNKLISTPALSASDVMEVRKIYAYLNSDNSINFEFNGKFKGYKYELLSGINSEYNDSERKQVIARYIIESGFQLENFSLLKPMRDTPEMILNYSASADHQLKNYGDESILKIFPIDFILLEEPKKRKLPVQINYPICQIDTTEYTFPEHFRINSIPENYTLSSLYGEYKINFYIEGSKVLAVKHLLINSGTIKVEEYLNFYMFWKSIIESENSLYISLNKK